MFHQYPVEIKTNLLKNKNETRTRNQKLKKRNLEQNETRIEESFFFIKIACSLTKYF